MGFGVGVLVGVLIGVILGVMLVTFAAGWIESGCRKRASSGR